MRRRALRRRDQVRVRAGLGQGLGLALGLGLGLGLALGLELGLGLGLGLRHSVAVTRRGRCFSWGLGGSGQLGLGEVSSGGWCSGVPREVTGLNAEVV